MKKKASCKGFQQPMLLEEQSLGDTDIVLEKATLSVQNDQPVTTTYESLSDIVAESVQMRSAEQLCKKLEHLIESHTRASLDRFKQNDLEPMHFLREMNECWRDNCRQLNMIRGIFLCLEIKCFSSESPALSTWDLGVEKFRHYFFNNSVVQKRTVDDILQLLEQERKGRVIDRALVKDVLWMMTSLSIYDQVFEPKFLDDTEKKYKAESQRLVNDLEVPEYLRYVKKVIDEETERSMHYLEASTQLAVISTIQRELIEAHVVLILNKGLDNMLDDMRTDELSLLYSLLARVSNGLHELCIRYNKHIKHRGKLIVTDPERDKTMVQDLLHFKRKMDKVLKECFNREERFVNTQKEAFEYFINLRPNKPAELIAKYIDYKLKLGNKESTEDELEETLDQILVLFRFIHGKDVFEAFFKKDLAKRLLVGKSASVDAEKSMLSKLRHECGSGFTSKLEGMFKDIDVSRDLMKHFKTYLACQNVKSSFDIHVNVLTMGFWPTYEPLVVNIPKFMKNQQKAFEKFYLSKRSGRKLVWQPNLDYCTLVATFEKKTHELMVSLFQALVLFMFNEKDELDYQEIAEHTKIDEVELKRTLQSLACGKHRVLIKEPKSKDVETGDKFIFHSKFQNQLHKLKINQVQLKETQEEQSMTEERIFQDRQYQIDAAIVRIMKTRISISLNALLTEIFEQLQFPVRPQDVKLRLESLIERDYIHRDKDKLNQFNYVS